MGGNKSEARSERIHKLMKEIDSRNPGISLKVPEWKYLINNQKEMTNLREVEIIAALNDLQGKKFTHRTPQGRWELVA
uniref:Uncharacterized protein n=1 Tax=Chromera velia CCMP2878 TaxID=1169474 RepID=A0A0G4G1P8_9ALVE|eukprot:Cvel_19747.t1-p1 / transcript=Cvel_19747.t1 / gene=Cvel_19747 / organism=Chromera_velia_CCMP2878 / gene_product=hypothetical protein / transcript_product=hypothetical protein / location=Cvel_scaffold1728:33032-34535(-) / protein_length=77 / sequence_SO=supercontig / SO=protein_coding / is_pseudo=false